MAGAAGAAGPAGAPPFSIPVRPPPVTPAGLSLNPLDYVFAKSIGLRDNAGQPQVVYMRTLKDSAADAAVDAADRLGLPRTVQNPDGTPAWLVPHVGQGRSDWDVFDMPTTVRAPATFSAADAQGYFNKFQTPLPALGVNSTYFDLQPRNIDAFFVRYNNDHDGGNNPGDLVMGAGPNGAPSQPFLHWGSFSGKVALIIDAILSQFNFPAGSFWGVAVHGADHTMLFQRLSFDAPDLQLITTLLLNMSNGATSDGRLGYTVSDDGMYFRVMIFNPSTGRGGQLPPALRKKTKTVWNPHPGLPCGPQALMMAYARHTESRSKVGHLKERPREMESYIEEMVEAVASPTDAWGYGELLKGAEWLRDWTGRRIDLTVLDAHVDHVVLFDTVSGVGVSDVQRRRRAVDDGDSGDECDDEEVEEEGEGEGVDSEDEDDPAEHPVPPRLRLFVMHDRVGGHFFTCFNPASLKDGRLWCNGCNKLYHKQSYRLHLCTKWACKLCGANHKSKDEFRAHFYSEEHVECPTCERLMPPGCLDVHKNKCKGIYRRCKRCGECYTDATKTNNPRAITPEQHAEMCGKRMRFCGVCNCHREPEHVCVRPRRDDFGFNYDKQRQEHCILDIECMRGERGRQVLMCASARFALPFVEGESLDDYNARHVAHQRSTPALRFLNISDLCQWMVSRKRTTFVLHNMGGYDGPILLWYMRYEMGVNLDTLMDGLKVMLAQFGSNRMIDSCNHLTTSLAKMPKMFFRPGQCPDVAKQHFPHEFNTPENQGYEGPLPDREFYGDPGNTDLDAWHAAERLLYKPHTETPWKLTSCYDYCDTDTLVLVMCWQAYRLSGILAGGVDPGGCVTAASFADKTWQHKDIPDEGVTSLPQGRDGDHIIRDMVDDSFHGGRTEGFIIYKEVRPGHKLVVDDVTSMYPDQMTGVLPNGLPDLYVNPSGPECADPLLPPGCPADFMSMVGVARVDITPPVFPSRPHFRPIIGDYDDDTGRYVFDLFPKTNYAITLKELALCVEHRYRLDRVHAVVVWRGASARVYKSFVHRFLKLKLESSAPIPEDKVDAFIEECQERYGFRPDRAALLEGENVALRALAKLLLNSSWGKQAQSSKPTTQHVTGLDACKLFANHTAGKIVVTRVEIDPYLPDRFAVSFHHRKNRERIVDHKRNKAIATVITGNARVHLYKQMLKYEGNVWYVDTDSVFAEVPEDTPDSDSTSVCPGVHLGEWASEVPEGAVWQRMVVLGAKCYALEGEVKATGKKIYKVRSKGIPMSSTAARTTVTFDNMRKLVRGDLPELSVDILHFRRQPKGHTYVGWMNKRIQQTPAKSETHGLGTLMTPFGPQSEARMERPSKRPRAGRKDPLPEPGWSLADPVRKARDPDSDSEMTDGEADAAMAAAVAAQDARLQDEARRSAFYDAITRAEEDGARAAYEEGRRAVRHMQNVSSSLMEFI